MSLDVGRNSGCTGTVDVPNNGTNTQFTLAVYFWKFEDTATSVDNTGTGDNNQSDSLTLIDNWNLLLKGRVQVSAWPQPATLQNAGGSLTLTFNKQGNDPTKDQKVSGTVRFGSVKYQYDKEDSSMWDVGLTADWINSPTFSNWPSSL